MNAIKVGIVIASVLALQACATGGATQEASYTEADELIIGVMTPEEQSCPRYTTKFCKGNGRLSLQCSCETTDMIETTLAGYAGFYW